MKIKPIRVLEQIAEMHRIKKIFFNKYKMLKFSSKTFTR